MKQGILKAKTPLKANKVPKKRKAPSITLLKRKADRLFSLSIRYRDGEKRDGEWWCQCVTCDSWNPMKNTHAGHFQKRGRLATRWNEENVNAQCPGCNTYRDGEQYKYSLAIDAKYGSGTAKKLYELAKTDFRPNRASLEEVIHDAEEQIRFYQKVDLSSNQ